MNADPIKNYFIIGDLHTAAVLSKEGSIDWLCFPHFDSPSVFAGILDDKGGSFHLMTEGYEINSEYVEDTAMVEFTASNGDSRFSLRDFMVPQEINQCDTHFLVRKVKGVSGSSKVAFFLNLRPDYARQYLKLNQEGNLLSASLGNHRIFIRLPEESNVVETGNSYEIRMELNEGETKYIVMEYVTDKHIEVDPAELERSTERFWKDWIARGTFIGFCRNVMKRSAITLKLMQFYPTGALIASPTTSLPEDIGGERNWDYRYMWVRDATFTLYAFYILGYNEEMRKFFSLIEDISAGCEKCNGKIHTMYTINGDHVPDEEEMEHLSGYMDSSPVRIGNNAFHQFQLDIYGSLIDAYYFMWRRGLEISKKGKFIVKSLGQIIEDNWMQKDSGIWEVRSEEQHFTYSKVMAWVGIDRMCRMSEVLEMTDHEEQKWTTLAEKIKNWIWENCYNPDLGSFVQHPNTKRQDATNLLFILLQFLDRHEERTKQIVSKTFEELGIDDIYVNRYLTEDGLEGNEGAFILCTFWLMAARAAAVDPQLALSTYEKFEDLIADNNLLAEEIDPGNGGYLGNHPQSFSHMGLILAAYYVDKYGKRKKE